MDNIFENFDGAKNNTQYGMLLIILIGYELSGLFFFNLFVASGVILIYFDFNTDTLNRFLSQPISFSDSKFLLYMMQGIVSIGAFIVTPWLFLKMKLKKDVFSMFQIPTLKSLLLVLVITLSFMVVNTFFIEWNQNWIFPDFLGGFDTWARDKEMNLRELTNYLTEFNNTNEFFVALFVIAVIPSIGEELLFRGLIQNLINKITNNVHVAIWVTAFIFGVIHMQFFSFFPRMLLGGLFGYLYIFSGRLILPIFAHFLNNALTIILMYAFQIGWIGYNINENENTPQGWIILVFLIIFIYFLYYFKKYFKKNAKMESRI